jgi:hypothetical protein
VYLLNVLSALLQFPGIKDYRPRFRSGLVFHHGLFGLESASQQNRSMYSRQEYSEKDGHDLVAEVVSHDTVVRNA